jgi:hypothetical protein
MRIDLSGNVDFSTTDDIKIIDQPDGPTSGRQNFGSLWAPPKSNQAGPSSKPMLGSDSDFPEGTLHRFQGKNAYCFAKCVLTSSSKQFVANLVGGGEVNNSTSLLTGM